MISKFESFPSTCGQSGFTTRWLRWVWKPASNNSKSLKNLFEALRLDFSIAFYILSLLPRNYFPMALVSKSLSWFFILAMSTESYAFVFRAGRVDQSPLREDPREPKDLKDALVSQDVRASEGESVTEVRRELRGRLPEDSKAKSEKRDSAVIRVSSILMILRTTALGIMGVIIKHRQRGKIHGDFWIWLPILSITISVAEWTNDKQFRKRYNKFRDCVINYYQYWYQTIARLWFVRN